MSVFAFSLVRSDQNLRNDVSCILFLVLVSFLIDESVVSSGDPLPLE